MFTVKMATSLISEEQAWVSLNAQVSATFDSVAQTTKDEWHNLLSNITVTSIADTQDTLTVFYSSVYRAAQFPRFTSEYTAAGEEQHFSTYKSQKMCLAAYQNNDSSGMIFPGRQRHSWI